MKKNVSRGEIKRIGRLAEGGMSAGEISKLMQITVGRITDFMPKAPEPEVEEETAF